jgi:flagellar biosynthesis protein FlhG
MLGHRVAAVDLDLGGANLHLFLGVRSPARTLAHFWSGAGTGLADLCLATDVAGLSLVAGDSSTLGASNVAHFQKQRLLRQLRGLPADIVVVDLGGDTTFNTLDFLLHADERLVVTTEDPAAVLDAYNLVKVGLLRWLSRYLVAARERPALSPAAESCCARFVEDCGRPAGPVLPAFLAELSAIDAGAAATVEGALAQFRPRLVLNQAGPAGGRHVVERIREVCRQHLRIDVDLCHMVPADPQVSQVTRRLTNVVNARLEGDGARAIWAIAHKLVRAAADVPAPAGRPRVQTRFFQPPWVFPLLSHALAGRRSGRRGPFRAWHLGAGAGEGAYSLAIALAEAGRQEPPLPYRVWATGLQDDELARARRGAYPLVLVDGLQPETLRRYFLRGTGLSGGMCSVKDSVREHVSFVPGPATLKSLSDQPPADLILLDMAAEAFSVMTRSEGGQELAARLEAGGLLVVPAWPRGELPVPGFSRVADGIFARSASRARVA